MAGFHRRACGDSRHALLGASQNHHRRKDRKSRPPRRCDGGRDLWMVVFVVVASLAAQWLTGAWWVDGVGSLAIVYFLVKEGREAWSGDECECCA